MAAEPQSITFKSEAPTEPKVGQTYVVEATASSGLPVSLASATESVCTLSGSGSPATVKFIHVGTCTIAANQAGNAQWQPAPEVQQSMTVQKGSQTIAITSTAPNPGRVGDVYVAEATASSGLPVSLSSATESVCTIAGGESVSPATVTFTKVGTCTIHASQKGNADWKAAPQVSQAVTVEKKAQTITFKSEGPNPGHVGQTYSVEATASSGLAVSLATATPAVCTLSGSTVSFVAVGTCTITADQGGDGEWQEAPQVQQPITVEKGSQAITFSLPSEAAVGESIVATATASSGLPVSLASVTPAVCTLSGSGSGSTLSLIATGTCTIVAEQPGDENWEPAAEASQSTAVGPGLQTITFTSVAPGGARVGQTYVVQATSSSGLPVSLSTATPTICTLSNPGSGATVSLIGAGTCTIDASQAGDANWQAAHAQQSFAVSPVLVITPTPSPKPPSSPPPAATTAKSSFKAISATLHSPSFTITLQEQVSDPGTLSWVLTFPNGTFGVFASANAKAAAKGKCRAGFTRLAGKCRPRRVVFGKGSMSFAAAGTVTVTVKPSTAAKQAVRTALRRKRNMRITAVLTFKPRNGNAPVTHTQLLTVKLSGAK